MNGSMAVITGPIYDYISLGNGTSPTFKPAWISALPVDFIFVFVFHIGTVGVSESIHQNGVAVLAFHELGYFCKYNWNTTEFIEGKSCRILHNSRLAFHWEVWVLLKSKSISFGNFCWFSKCHTTFLWLRNCSYQSLLHCFANRTNTFRSSRICKPKEVVLLNYPPWFCRR